MAAILGAFRSAGNYAADTAKEIRHGLSRRFDRLQEAKTVTISRNCTFTESDDMQRVANIQPPTCIEKTKKSLVRLYNTIAPNNFQIQVRVDHLTQCALEGTIDQEYDTVVIAKTIEVWNSRTSFVMHETPDQTLAVNELMYNFRQPAEDQPLNNLMQHGAYVKVIEAEVTYARV
jgi:hypothetical protein